MNAKPQSPGREIELAASDYVVLGMVGLGASSGYAIKQTVGRSIRFFWTISQAQIYPSLERLERAGLLRGREEPRGRRPRRTYALTRAGRDALLEWMRDEDPMPFELRDTGMLKLFFADALGRDDGLDLLRRVRSRSESRVATLREIEPEARIAEDGGDLYPLLTLQMGIAFHEAVGRVCDEFEDRIAASRR